MISMVSLEFSKNSVATIYFWLLEPSWSQDEEDRCQELQGLLTLTTDGVDLSA